MFGNLQSALNSPESSRRLSKDDTISVMSDISRGSPVQRLGQGQPSPVSVLDVHSLEFTEIGPKSQGKRHALTLSHSVSMRNLMQSYLRMIH